MEGWKVESWKMKSSARWLEMQALDGLFLFTAREVRLLAYVPSPLVGEGQGEGDFMRPDWDSYFMEMATVARKRSTCLRRKVGAVLVKNHQMLTSGYNGAPAGLPHCDETGCLRRRLSVPSGERHEICRGLHAEQNAIIQAAQHGVSVSGSTMYITNQPCVICAKMIINAGVKSVVFSGDYPDELAKKMLEEAGVEMILWKPADSRE